MSQITITLKNYVKCPWCHTTYSIEELVKNKGDCVSCYNCSIDDFKVIVEVVK